MAAACPACPPAAAASCVRQQRATSVVQAGTECPSNTTEHLMPACRHSKEQKRAPRYAARPRPASGGRRRTSRPLPSRAAAPSRRRAPTTWCKLECRALTWRGAAAARGGAGGWRAARAGACGADGGVQSNVMLCLRVWEWRWGPRLWVWVTERCMRSTQGQTCSCAAASALIELASVEL